MYVAEDESQQREQSRDDEFVPEPVKYYVRFLFVEVRRDWAVRRVDANDAKLLKFRNVLNHGNAHDGDHVLAGRRTTA